MVLSQGNPIKNIYDLIVVGGGALGTFHAYHALMGGLSVALVERTELPMGATVRNFGQVVPSGMNSKWQLYGRRSLAIYGTLQSEFDISVRKNGSVYLASNLEERVLLEELFQINRNNDYPSELLTREQCLKKYPGLNPSYVISGLFFPEEVTVEPRIMIHRVLQYLVEQKKLNYLSNRTVIACEPTSSLVKVITSSGETLHGAKVMVCSGAEFKTLYPEIYNQSDLQAVKLQMLQTVPQKNYELKGSILTGLSIRRYEAFQECPSYPSIRLKENPLSFEKKWGIHILFKQATDGSVIIGDSHEYADAGNSDDLGFDLRADIDQFMTDEAKKIFTLPSFDIQHRWFGIYSQCKDQDIFRHSIGSNIHIVTGIGGKGMTGSAGFSKEHISSLFNKNL